MRKPIPEEAKADYMRKVLIMSGLGETTAPSKDLVKVIELIKYESFYDEPPPKNEIEATIKFQKVLMMAEIAFFKDKDIFKNNFPIFGKLCNK